MALRLSQNQSRTAPPDYFGFVPGRVLKGRYVVQEMLGAGSEGEVYRVIERPTGLQRALKVFYPDTPGADAAVVRSARLLDRLSRCPILIGYVHAETLRFKRANVPCLVSEYVDGEILEGFVQRSKGKRLPAFEALHIIYEITKGLETIHENGVYHGDLHAENILVKRAGIFFAVKIVDFQYRGRSTAVQKRNDIIEVIRLLYEITGGQRFYAQQPSAIKDICRGLRRDLILQRFPTIEHLAKHLETFD